jgi:PadR family transcriptional regulator PadR
MDLEKWETQARKGVLELCVLLLLRRGEMYGYDLAKALGSVHKVAVVEGTIYPILARLKGDGLVRTRLEESPNGPPRKYYNLTNSGRDAAAMMLSQWRSLSDAIEKIAKGDRGG